MTGFGEHRAKINDATYICRVRSLNHRFLDIKLRLPRTDLVSLDLATRKLLQDTFKRGAVELTLSIEANRDSQDVTFNTKLAASYLKQSKALAKSLKLKQSAPSLDSILRLPGVVQSNALGGMLSGQDDAMTKLSDAEFIKKIIEPALKELKKSRRAEGQKLKAFLIKHLDEMDEHLKMVKELEVPEKERARTQIIERAKETVKLLTALSSTPTSDEFNSRLREEAVFWIERRDFAEERDRLGMHLKEFRNLILNGLESAGRKLEFLQQEILREINTLGTKAQSPAITKHTIELKTILERIREQLANVE